MTVSNFSDIGLLSRRKMGATPRSKAKWRALYAGFLAISVICIAEEPPPRPPVPNVQPRGPQVEVTLRDGRTAFSAYLTRYKDGEIDFQMLAGETRHERASDVQSIRYLQPLPESGTDSPHRMRELLDRDKNGTLMPEEIDELYKLREKAQIFAGNPTPFERRIIARTMAQYEDTRGRSDRHIALYQQRLKHVETEEEARDCVIMLTAAYFEKRQTLAKVKEQLQRDVQSIPNAEIRKKVERMPDVVDLPRKKDLK